MLKTIIARGLVAILMALVLIPVLQPVSVLAQDQQHQGRKVKTKVEPVYPDVAKRMNLMGTVKLQAVIAADGTVKSIRPLGGNPLLIEAATDALKKWRWAAGEESIENIAFNFSR